MKPRYLSVVSLSLLLGVAWAGVDDQKVSSPPISKQTRMDVIRGFNAELVYLRTAFPMGTRGLTLKDGQLTPSGADLERMMAMWGPSAKPGDQALITAVMIKSDRIHFEINGGPIRKKKWYQRIEVGGSGGTVPITPSDSNANARGSFVELVFDHYVPELNPQQLKDLLRPVFNFEAKSAEEAYLETVPPKVKEAIKNHQVLVGMNREMLIHARGRAPKKVREKDGEAEYEEWIYGEPPQDVDFVRLMGDEVVRIETMKVTGERIVRAEKEVELEQPRVAKGQDEPEVRPAGAPSLRRPGEAPDPSMPPTAPGPGGPPIPPPTPPAGAPPPQWRPGN